MMTDRYTKTVLTLIAACLVWQCILTMGKRVDAQQLSSVPAGLLPGHAQPVVIVGWGEMTTQGQVALSFRRVGNGVVTDPYLPVRFPYTAQNPMPVAQSPAQPPVAVSITSPVKLAYTADQPLAVGLTGIQNRAGRWDAINTRVESAAPRATPGLPQ